MRREKLLSEVRRPQIANAVLAVIGSRGLAGLSVAAVARRVGLAPSAIYRHYPSKSRMLDAIVDLVRGRLLANLQIVRAETTDPIEALERLLARHVQLIRENENLPRLLFSEDFFHDHPERKVAVLDTMMRYLGGIEELLREGQRRGRVRRDLDPRTVAVLFVGLFQPAGVLWSLSDGAFDVTRQARDAWPVFRDAITTAPRARRRRAGAAAIPHPARAAPRRAATARSTPQGTASPRRRNPSRRTET